MSRGYALDLWHQHVVLGPKCGHCTFCLGILVSCQTSTCKSLWFHLSYISCNAVLNMKYIAGILESSCNWLTSSLWLMNHVHISWNILKLEVLISIPWPSNSCFLKCYVTMKGEDRVFQCMWVYWYMHTSIVVILLSYNLRSPFNQDYSYEVLAFCGRYLYFPAVVCTYTALHHL